MFPVVRLDVISLLRDAGKLVLKVGNSSYYEEMNVIYKTFSI